MKLTEEEKKALEGSGDQSDYARVVKAIKANRKGEYPHDWWQVVMEPGGISDKLKKKWQRPDAFDLKLSSPSEEDLKNGRL